MKISTMLKKSITIILTIVFTLILFQPQILKSAEDSSKLAEAADNEEIVMESVNLDGVSIVEEDNESQFEEKDVKIVDSFTDEIEEKNGKKI